MLTQEHVERGLIRLNSKYLLVYVPHLIDKQLQDEGGDTAIDANEEVDGGEDHVGSAGDGEDEGGWVHEWSDRPTAAETNKQRITDVCWLELDKVVDQYG